MNGSGTTTLRRLIHDHKGVRVPLIQRDYAQGRRHEREVREDFLHALKRAVGRGGVDRGEPINLDFVYGTFESPGYDGKTGSVFEPLDGQQRMTTLFLLHWYLANRDNQKEEFDKVFCQTVPSRSAACSRFTYRVRQSSREFFDQLVRFKPDFDNLLKDSSGEPSLRETILDQPWYFSRWKYDPSVQSSLVMLDAIHRHFADCEDGFSRLMNEDRPAITFNFLDLEAKEFKLTDDLYVKMNARGKLLTPFETLKARYEELLKGMGEEGGCFACEEFGQGEAKGTASHFVSWRFDREWTDYFWQALDLSELDDISAGKTEIASVLDQRIMNLLHAIAVVSLDPDKADGNYDEALKALRNKDTTASYHLFDQSGCINEAFTRLLIAFMETKVSSDPAQSHYQATAFFDDTSFLKGVTENAAGESLVDFALFAGYLWFLQKHGNDRPDSLREWMRFMRNLMRNSRVERRDDFRLASSIIRQLVPHAIDILYYLRSGEAAELKFRNFGIQFDEERLKAQLLGVDRANWRELIEDAESHGYFQGQIFCLLEFSGVCAAAKKQPVAEWPDEMHRAIQGEFRTYLRKLKSMFNDKGLIAGEGYRWERGLLSLGNYLLPGKSNFSFLNNAQPEETRWKRLLSNSEGVESQRHLLKDLWDKLDLNASASLVQQLDDIISESSGGEAWLGLLVSHPEAIEYCEQRYIRLKEVGGNGLEPEVYLLSKQRIYAAHTELRSYCLYHDMRSVNQSTWAVDYEDYTYHPMGSHLCLTTSNAAKLVCRIGWKSADGFLIRLEGQGLEVVKPTAIEHGFHECDTDPETCLRKTSKQLDRDTLFAQLDVLLEASAPSKSPS
jgi:hypothetical protein